MAAEDTAAEKSARQNGRPIEKPPKSLPRSILAALVVAYAVSIGALWLWMYLQGDRSWLATLFLFGPRWVCAVPLLPLAICAAIWQPRMLWILAVAAVLIVGPILGFELHFGSGDGTVALRVLTCNVNQSQFRIDQLAELVERDQPDVVALQEVAARPPRFLWPRGWYVVVRDEYLVASRFPIIEREAMPCPEVPGKLAAIRYTIRRPHGEVQLFNLHLLSPRRGLEAVLDRDKGLDVSETPNLEAMLRARAAESRLASDWIRGFEGPKIVVGDFNMPVESAIFRQDWSWLDNAFSTSGFGFGFTKITEKRGWRYGTRIDHVLYSPPWRSVRSWIGPDIGSDHLPLVAEFD
jgi:vancomycin resistance protein VanJ